MPIRLAAIALLMLALVACAEDTPDAPSLTTLHVRARGMVKSLGIT